MKNLFVFTMLVMLAAGLTSLIFTINDKVTTKIKPIISACTQEAKMCPDGVTYVGRVGPRCEFEACPSVYNSSGNTTNTEVTSTTSPLAGTNVTLTVGQVKKVGDLNITLNQLIQDNRCPIDVQCIQAGAATVKITLQNKNNIEVTNISSNQNDYSFGGYSIKITSVMPEQTTKRSIFESEYKITFNIQKK